MLAAMAKVPPFVRIIGLPGAFTQWGTELLRLLFQRCGAELRAATSIEGVEPGRERVVPYLVAHGPDYGSGGREPAVGTRTVVFLDEPASALRDLIASGQHPKDAVRTLTATLAPLPAILAEPSTLLVPRRGGLTALEALSAVASHLGLSVDLAKVAANEPPGSPPASLLTDEASNIADEALLPLARYVLNGGTSPITWPIDCFYDGDRPGEPAPGVIDLVGPARVVCYGPYYHMPRGSWRLEAELDFSDAHSTFFIDVFTGEVLAKVRLCPERAGVFLANFPVTIARPEDPVEVRLWLEHGAIEGSVGLRRVMFHPQD